MTLSRQYMPLRRSLCHFSAQTRRAPCNFQNTFRRYSAEKRSSEPKSFVVWRPYLRLAIGVPFIGALIYSMVNICFEAKQYHLILIFSLTNNTDDR